MHSVRRLVLFIAFACPGLLVPTPSAFAAHPSTDVTILTREDWVPGPAMSVADVLARVPSLNLAQYGLRGNRVFAALRGLSSSSLLVTVNGRPVNRDYGGAVDLAEFPLDGVERIEITRGGASLGYGAGAASGVINIVTAHPEQKGLIADMGVDAGRNGARDVRGRFFARSYYGDMTYTTSHDNASGFTQNDAVRMEHHYGAYTRSFKGKGYWGFDFDYHENRTGLTRGTTVPIDQWDNHAERHVVTPSAFQDTERQTVGAHFASPPLAGTTVYLDLTWLQRNLKVRENADAPAFPDENRRALQGRLDWRHPQWEAGVESRRDEQERFGEAQQSAVEHAAFVEGVIDMDRLTLRPGVRYDWDNHAGGALTPRFAGVVAVAKDVFLNGSAEVAHRMPTLAETHPTAAAANPDLEMETTRSADLGLGWRRSGRLSLRGTAFRHETKDAILFDTTQNQFKNDGRRRSRGVEFETTAEVGEKSRWTRFLTRGQWSFVDTQSREPVVGAWRAADFAPKSVASFELEHHLPRKITLTQELRYESVQFSGIDRTGVRLPAHTVWNTRVGLKILTADAYAQIDNVTRTRYATAVEAGPAGTLPVPLPERVYWVGITIRFIN